MRKAIMHSVLADANDGRPILQIRDTCQNLIETIPQLIVDEHDPEDIDTDGPDHAYDALTEALLMETPHFAQSSGIRFGDIPMFKPVPMGVGPENDVILPDIMDAVKHHQAAPPRRPTAR